MSTQSPEIPEQKKTVTITVNAREHQVPKGKITYQAVVALAFPNPNFDNYLYKITYFRSAKQEDKAHEGTLSKGQDVEARDGLVFTVVRSTRS